MTAAHVGGANSGNFGVALLGNLVGRAPTREARASLIEVLAILAKVPGSMQARLPAIRDAVARRMAALPPRNRLIAELTRG